MVLVIDISHPETNLEEVEELANHLYDDNERRYIYRFHMYVFGRTDSIEDAALEYHMEDEAEFDSTDEVFEYVEKNRQRNQQQRSADQSLDSAISGLCDVFEYVFTGENYDGALQAQQEAISDGGNLSVAVGTENL